MSINSELAIHIAITVIVAFIIAFVSTPAVKVFAQKVGAIDVPNEERRVHDHPIPRMGGLAIFLGFLLSVLLFADIDRQVQGILIGAIIIVITGAIDDVVSLNAWLKFLIQIAAAGIAVYFGVRIEVLMNPVFWSDTQYLVLGGWSIPLSILWIVAITNSVNLIDGLDGLAVGISTISSITMLIIALIVADSNVAVILAALAGACIGFMPYNFNPAKIFMGDTGALLLGYVLSTVSVMGLFKFYAVVNFAVPVLAIAVPLFDTVFAVFRRLLSGKKPFEADRGHIHHRLIDMGLSQKQAVVILYAISAILGLAAVVITTTSRGRVLIVLLAFVLCVFIWLFAFSEKHKNQEHQKSEIRAADKHDNKGSDDYSLESSADAMDTESKKE